MSERAKHANLVVPREMRELIRRRVLPFLDSVGIDRPISFVLEEVYLQGMRDALQAIEAHHKP